MTPLAIYLKGFLSFRDEQELTVEQDCISLLHGPNGAGKSTVFDAILFALYGQHRAGSDNLQELINKGCDEATVRLDFLLDGTRYRAERHVERTRDRKTGREGYASTQQLYELQDERWNAVPGTHRQADYKAWIKEHVGLSVEAFTSSVLLMQGRADTLTGQDATAANRRFEVLSRIVDLHWFQGLHASAEDERKARAEEVVRLRGKLDGVAPVSDEELTQIDERQAAVGADLARAEEHVASLQKLRDKAVCWLNLQGRLDTARQQWNETRLLTDDAEAIERAGRRFSELAQVLPLLERIDAQQQQALQAEAATQKLQTQSEELNQRTAEVAVALENAARAQSEIETEQAAEDSRRQALTEERNKLGMDVPLLSRLRREREGLRQQREQAAALSKQLTRADEEQRQREAEMKPRTQQREQAAEALREAERRLTRAETQLKNAQQRRDRFASVAGAPSCSYCGQLLDDEHRAQEELRIAEELAAHEAELAAAAKAQKEAARADRKAATELRDAEKALAETQQAAANLRRDHDAAERDAQRHEKEVREAYLALDGEFRARVSTTLCTDWTATIYPTADDLVLLERSRVDLAARQKALADAAAPRQAKLKRLRDEQTQLQKRREELRQQRSDCETMLGKERLRGELARQNETQARAALPANWQAECAALNPAQLRDWRAEHDRLKAQDADGRCKRLQTAQHMQEHLRQNFEKLRLESESIPPEARRDPARLEPELRAAREHDKELRREQVRLQTQKQQLVERRAQRRTLEADLKNADRRRYLAQRLAELLGKRQLQRHLLRQAEQGIVENANHVLDRLTTGQLVLRLVPGEENDDNRALELEVYKPQVGQTFGLAFLSGSERFRVAVSLALGIGQYASRQRRAIESVIIDEGFGCLDRDNRQTMIEEIRKLRGQLRCILLVSHQEEFGDAFPDGYRFEMVNDTTRVTRLEG